MNDNQRTKKNLMHAQKDQQKNKPGRYTKVQGRLTFNGAYTSVDSTLISSSLPPFVLKP